MKITGFLICMLFSLNAFCQDHDLGRDEIIRRYEQNLKRKPIDKSKFYFKDVVALEHTGVRTQKGEGTCWSYATNSFLESEMMRMGKKPYDLSCIYSLRCAYMEKAESYIRMHGGIAWGEGGEMHDVMNMLALYGAMPEAVYPGNGIHITAEKIAQMNDALRGFLDKIIDNPATGLARDWRQAFDAIMVSFIGDAPDKFNFDQHNYNPATFARKCVGIHPEDYVELASVINKPMYKEMTLLVPDNWAFNRVYNVKMDDLTDIVDRALSRGFTVAWEADISEPYFSWHHGIAYVPEKEYDEMSPAERHSMFAGPKMEKYISPQLRQISLDNLETTDDHAMHIVGVAEDQNHKKYYKVKNSWDTGNEYNGFIYVTKAYLKYKTSTIMLHKSALSVEMRNNLNLGTTGNSRLFFR